MVSERDVIEKGLDLLSFPQDLPNHQPMAGRRERRAPFEATGNP